ncbi:TPA: hypothetical protein HA235_07125 [Candidatus Woesearchaeota archaeon]|nr:hypothetical protein [uncultured archaeon]MBS3172799.1 hypothetical protein [Candidatus Woesearchaeota archaeon]HIH32449.1 hypothetical protein [Candidatus Woesearchaeota archaeon]HIH55366.1 hypothetical protein [Candidatus Woesearchaeota archaeon]HIJ02286.1 hypothetical protein [Candidatus Woesearchaeota archaeon]
MKISENLNYSNTFELYKSLNEHNKKNPENTKHLAHPIEIITDSTARHLKKGIYSAGDLAVYYQKKDTFFLAVINYEDVNLELDNITNKIKFNDLYFMEESENLTGIWENSSYIINLSDIIKKNHGEDIDSFYIDFKTSDLLSLAAGKASEFSFSDDEIILVENNLGKGETLASNAKYIKETRSYVRFFFMKPVNIESKLTDSKIALIKPVLLTTLDMNWSINFSGDNNNHNFLGYMVGDVKK